MLGYPAISWRFIRSLRGYVIRSSLRAIVFSLALRLKVWEWRDGGVKLIWPRLRLTLRDATHNRSRALHQCTDNSKVYAAAYQNSDPHCWAR